MILPASYSNGFAPRDGQPLYPELWRGCVGAWAPCLGPSGLTLRDWSAFKNHGTLTNMASDSDWVTNGGRYALDLDGTNDYVDCGTGVASTLGTSRSFTISLFCFLRSSDNDGIFYVGSFASSQGAFAFATVSTSLVLRMNNQAFSTSTPNSTYLNKWVHFAITYNGSSVTFFANGSTPPVLSGAFAQDVVFSGSTIIGGYFNSSFTANMLIDDVRVHNRALSPQEITLLASRRGIAYEMAPRRRTASEAATSFNRRRRLLIGASS